MADWEITFPRRESRTHLAYSSFFAVKNDLRYIICHTLVETNMMMDRMLNHCTLDDVDSEGLADKD